MNHKDEKFFTEKHYTILRKNYTVDALLITVVKSMFFKSVGENTNKH